jgi:integrase
MGIRRKNNKWEYRFTFDGRPYSGSTGLAATRQNETEARRLESDHRTALLEGRRPKARVVVREFEDAAVEFLEWAKATYRAHPNSWRRIATSLSSARVFFKGKVVSLIDEADLERYKTWRANEHQVRDVTIKHDLNALSTFFQYAAKQHWTHDNPVRRVKIPSDKDAIRIHIVSLGEETLYFAQAAKRPALHDLGRLILNQGCRPEEGLALDKKDIDLGRGQMHIRSGKTAAARRTLDLTPESRSILARRMAGESPWVFPSKRKPGQHIVRLNTTHDCVCKKAKVAFCLYDLRHTFATRMAQAGIDLATLAAILGHSGLRVVQKYVHPTAEHKREAMQKYAETMTVQNQQPKTVN